MRVLVTGATGRVGSRLVRRLAVDGLAGNGLAAATGLAAGTGTEPAIGTELANGTGVANGTGAGGAVRVVVRDPRRAADLAALGMDVVAGDLLDPDTLKRAVADVDAVVHLAAAFRGVSEEETVAVTRDATLGLARAALDAGVGRFVFTSTNLVYGPGRGRPAVEDDEPRPVGAYPTAKAAAEQALRDLHRESGLGLRILRLAFVYGDGDPHLAESLMFAAHRPAHWRLQMVHHADVAQAVTLVLRAAGVDGRVYNVADDAPVTGWELHALQGRPAPDVAGEPDPWEGVVDTGRIRHELGYRPIHPTVYSARAAGAL